MDVITIDIQGILTGAVMLGGLASVFIEITPIKFNPLSFALKWAGSKLASGFAAELKQDIAEIKTDTAMLKESVENIDNKVDNNEIDRIRWEVLDFTNSCRNKRKHTKEEFHHIMSLDEKYHDILEWRGKENGQIDMASKYIHDLYWKCLTDGGFLCENGDDDC